ncbi:hypothetical protein [Rhizobacter sp. OV335]|uniref:hypothetical protein n=1 Tax=Rhizobacter sp. OV335 TaxID=1500264 RepID=UPI001161405E|nr:hypothetical protein [Rhizobacter sp. OV335]
MIEKKIDKFTAWVKRRTSPARPPERKSIKVERRKSERLLRSIDADPMRSERRQSLPILQMRSTTNVVEKEPKNVRRARKQKFYVAAALNLFEVDRRLEMMKMAALLSDFSAAVEPTWVAMSPDASGPRFTCFELRLNEKGEIDVKEKIRRRVDTAAIELEPVHVFTDDQMRRGKAQLHAVFLWLFAEKTGFHEAPPVFMPLHLAASLSED